MSSVKVAFAVSLLLVSEKILVSTENILASQANQISKKRNIKRDSTSTSSSPSQFDYSSSNSDQLNNVDVLGYYHNYLDNLRGHSEPNHFDQNHPIKLLSFPIGTKITLTPGISVPVVDSTFEETSVKTTIDAQLPITFTIKDFPGRTLYRFQDHFHSKFGTLDRPRPHNHERDQIHELGQQRLLSRKIRDVTDAGNSTSNTIPPVKERNMFSNNENPAVEDYLQFISSERKRICGAKGLTDRRTILQRMEIFVTSFLGKMDSPKGCLLRWTCELHENTVAMRYYGLLGEGALLAFSTKEQSQSCDPSSPDMKYLKPFIKAEVAGKGGNCLSYEQLCSRSIFTN